MEYGAAFALALSGDVAQSKALAADLEKRSEDTYVRFAYLPTLRELWAIPTDELLDFGIQDFLTLGKDADPEIPILQAAKAEYATLQ